MLLEKRSPAPSPLRQVVHIEIDLRTSPGSGRLVGCFADGGGYQSLEIVEDPLFAGRDGSNGARREDPMRV